MEWQTFHFYHDDDNDSNNNDDADEPEPVEDKGIPREANTRIWKHETVVS